SVLGNDAEYLPIDVEGEASGSWYLLNTLHVPNDAIDYDKSHYFTMSTGDRILTRPVFVDQKIPNDRIFVYPNSYNRIGVKGDFLKELVFAHKLTGLRFDPCETVKDDPIPQGVVR
ncbi:MAG: hypothetical protein HY308_03440, partial [Gammaproteobacteria bacterium]|nr:hypothetical protein [Gammaproteobacteria bacterium]